MDRECMNVVYASNDAYARHLGTSMYSLFDRNRDFAEITVYVLTLGLSRENQKRLEEIAAHLSGNWSALTWMTCRSGSAMRWIPVVSISV